MRRTPGIYPRHRSGCGARGGNRCSCRPTYEVKVRVGETQISRSFPSEAAARAWKLQMEANKAAGLLRSSPRAMTVREAGEALIRDMTSGVARARGGDPYKPRLIGDYGRALERRIYPAFGSVKLPDLRRRQIQVLIDRMVADGYDGGTIRNAIKPLQV